MAGGTDTRRGRLNGPEGKARLRPRTGGERAAPATDLAASGPTETNQGCGGWFPLSSTMLVCENFGLSSAPRLPQAVQVEARLDVRQSHMSRPAVGADLDMVAALVIAAIYQDVADAGCAHLAEFSGGRGSWSFAQKKARAGLNFPKWAKDATELPWCRRGAGAGRHLRLTIKQLIIKGNI